MRIDMTHPQADDLVVTLDGRACLDCIEADEEAGTVRRIKRRRGRPVIEASAVQYETARGRVEIALKGGGRPVPLETVVVPAEADMPPVRERGQNTPAVSVLGYVADLIYMSRRNLDRSFGGRWQTPGGRIERDAHVRSGETPRQAAWRELAEEAGVNADSAKLRYLGRELHSGSNGRSFWLYFFAFDATGHAYLHLEPDLMSEWYLIPKAAVGSMHTMWGLRGRIARAFVGEWTIAQEAEACRELEATIGPEIYGPV